MGSSRWPHLAIAAVAAAAVAVAQPKKPQPKPAAGSGSGSAVVAFKSAGSSAVESMADIPVWKPSPPRFAVAPFDNESGVRAMDWLVAGAPFEISEKTEDVLGLEPTGGTLHVGGEKVPSEVEPVTAFAKKHDAQWVITGWVDRSNWKLRIGLTLWKAGAGDAFVVHEAQKLGEMNAYHALLGETLAEVWSKAGITIDIDRKTKLSRPLATDVYAVNLMGRGLGHLTGALGAVNLKAAEHDLERAVFIDPKCYEAQRLLGELYSVLAVTDPKLGGDPKLGRRAAGKYAYANDLAPDDIASLRAAAVAAGREGKHEPARVMWRKLVTRKPWDLDARFELGSAMWQTGDAAAAEVQLLQVTTRKPDHLQARRVLVLIHSSRSDTAKLVTELEAIATRAPTDLDVKADLATAYGALNQWDKASRALEQIASVRTDDMPLAVRIGDAKRKQSDLDGALQWYSRAARIAPESSFPGFSSAQALFDAGRFPEAIRTYTLLQKYRVDLPAAEQALAAIALLQNRPDDAAWYMRRAVREAPRNIVNWRTLVAAELTRKDLINANKVLERGLLAWPRDGQLLYLAGVSAAMGGDRASARDLMVRALDASPGHAGARAGLGALDAGGSVTLMFTPELVRPWGDAQALEAALDRYAVAATTMAAVRVSYQSRFLMLIAALGKGPYAPVKTPPVRRCPVATIASMWDAAQQELRRYERLGTELESAYRFIARHDEAGATTGLLPNSRSRVSKLKKDFRTTLADVGELRSEWVRGVIPELRMAGCSDKLLAAAVADPERYRVDVEERPEAIPATQAPRPRARATFYIDNQRCADPVNVWIDGTHLGEVAPGRRSALVSDGGERTLCLIVPGGAQCGDRGTLRQVYLHDGWTATMHCNK
jgi:Flp pilus assembly protein TadD